MNYIDLIIAAIFVYSAYKGFSKGLVVYAASLIALLLGIFGAIRFSWFTSDIILRNFNVNIDTVPIVSFAITFIAIVIGVQLLAKALDKIVKAVALGFVNRILGLLFSVIKNAFIVSIVLVIFTSINDNMNIVKQETIDNSILYRPIARFAPSVFPNLNFHEMSKRFEDIKQKMPSGNEA
jgi:membrane protein required for colicin V production